MSTSKNAQNKNLFYDLPDEIQKLIYEYDDTYREKYNKVLKELITSHDYDEFTEYFDEFRWDSENPKWIELGNAKDGLNVLYQEYKMIEEEQFVKIHYALMKKIKNLAYVERLELCYEYGGKNIYLDFKDEPVWRLHYCKNCKRKHPVEYCCGCFH